MGGKIFKTIYTFIPMVYPQVKLIAYFNAKMNYEVNYYNLDGDSELQNAYNDVTESPCLYKIIIQTAPDNSLKRRAVQ